MSLYAVYTSFPFQMLHDSFAITKHVKIPSFSLSLSLARAPYRFSMILNGNFFFHFHLIQLNGCCYGNNPISGKLKRKPTFSQTSNLLHRLPASINICIHAHKREYIYEYKISTIACRIQIDASKTNSKRGRVCVCVFHGISDTRLKSTEWLMLLAAVGDTAKNECAFSFMAFMF